MSPQGMMAGGAAAQTKRAREYAGRRHRKPDWNARSAYAI